MYLYQAYAGFTENVIFILKITIQYATLYLKTIIIFLYASFVPEGFKLAYKNIKNITILEHKE